MTSFFEFFQNNGNLVILNLILQITLLSGIAIILACRYKNNAAARYGILFPALISLLLLTAASLFLQSRNTSLFYLPVEIEKIHTQAAATGFVFDELGISEFELDSVPTEPADLGVIQNSIAEEKSINTAWELLLGLPPYLILMGIWIGGFLILTMGLLRSFHNIEQVSRRSLQPSLIERQRLDKLLARVLSKRARVPFRISDQISSPMLTGLISPVILLPENFIASLSERQLKSVLLHELAHFERKDLLANFLQKIIFAIFWFHPLIHMMDRMIARAREEICDNYVLAKEQPLDYSEALLHVSTLTSKCESGAVDTKLAVAMFGSEWKLEQRIGELLNENRERAMKLNRRTGRVLQSFLVAGSLLLAACQLEVAESNDAVGYTDEQSGLAQDVIVNQQDVERQAERVSQQLIDQSAQLEDVRQQLEKTSLQVQDQGEDLQQQKPSLADQASVTVEQIELLELDARELELERRELEIRVMADEKEKVLRRQEQLKRELIGINPAVTTQGTPQDSAAVYIQAQATTQAQPQAQTQSQVQSRPAPEARTAGTLSPRVMEAISQIQEYMQPADSDTLADMDAAKELLDRLYSERFEAMNDFEKSTTLSFYTNYYLGTDNYPEAIRSFEQTLVIETLRDDIRLRTLRSLGQLYAAAENWQESIQNYQLWREASPQEDEVTFRGLSYAHYQLEQFSDALPSWLSYMDLVKDNDGELNREDYAYLNGLYFTLEDFDSSLELTKEMILLFNDSRDWGNLRAIFKTLDSRQDATQVEQELIVMLGGNGFGPQISQSTSLSIDDVDYLPLVTVAPQYPTRAAQRGIQGWILLSFTVDEQGNVLEDTVDVIDAEPQNIFNRSAIRAATKFKYEPRIRNGEAVAVPGVQYVFRYELNENV